MNAEHPKVALVDDKKDFLETSVPRILLFLNICLSVVYFLVIAFLFKKSNAVIFWLLIGGEVFHVWQALTFIHTIWDTEYEQEKDFSFKPLVDVFITVTGEPLYIVRETVEAALRMRYPRFKVHILNDGFVAKKENWRDVEELAKSLGVSCITRKIPGGAKAGNINNALRKTSRPFVAIFDCDHVPHVDFLEKMMAYFHDDQMAFVQSPQFYKNYHLNKVTQGAWEQQTLFFGAICKGKNRLNSVPMCGTNMVIRRKALVEVGGMYEESITEDFMTGLLMHEHGWKSAYLPEVVAEGLAPQDFLSYYKQQFRWARGALDVLFEHNIFRRTKLTWKQRIQYLSSVSFFLSGSIILMNACIPLVFFFLGIVPFQTSTMLLAAVFLPYIFLTLYILQRSCNYSFTYRSLAFSMAGFTLHIQALIAAITQQKTQFTVTSKQETVGNYLSYVIPHMVYISAVVIGLVVVILRDGLVPSVVSNAAWAAVNVAIFSEFIMVAAPKYSRVRSAVPKPVVAPRVILPRTAQKVLQIE